MNVSDEQIEELFDSLAGYKPYDYTAVRDWLAPILEQHVKAEIERMGKEPVAEIYFPLWGEPGVIWSGLIPERPSNHKVYAAQPDLQAQLDAVREECAEVCNKYGSEKWDMYKYGGSNEPSSYTEGQSDAADELEGLIRSRIGKPSPLAQLQAENAEMRDSAIALYMSGRWECRELTPEQQAALWVRLRDAAHLPNGTATKAGVAAQETSRE